MSRYYLCSVAAMLVVGLLAPPLARAQGDPLDENCTVSILNRTVRVKPDGSWLLPSVPAGFGRVRARATCVRDGRTVSGQSEFFTLSADRMNSIVPIELGEVTPIPARLTLSGVTELTAEAPSTQLSVIATYPDGSEADVSVASAGTSYTTSNPTVAVVGPDGRVAAVSSGSALISALNEGTLGIVRVRVILSGDSDGDGIPDDTELALGLNPNDPIDALEDPDGDGLETAREVALGIDFRNADTDGDGIGDGEEIVVGVDGFVTRPELADTDGDGVRDGLEIETGSDPTDSSSLNLADALAGLRVTPEAFVIVFNTVAGDASRQLTVTGELRDGFEIDLTSTGRGTNYASADLEVANFGATAGDVFAGGDGTTEIIATNSGFSARAFVTVRTFRPQALASLPLPGAIGGVDVLGDVAYVAAAAEGVHVVDVADRSRPVLESTVDTPGSAVGVQVAGDLLLVADGSAGLQIFDVTTPRSPTFLGSRDTPGEAIDVVAAGARAFVADGAAGVQVIEITNPAVTSIVAEVATPSPAIGVDVDPSRSLLVVAMGTAGIEVVDISDESSPVSLASLPGGDPRDLVLAGDIALLADFTGFRAVDLTDPSLPMAGASAPADTGGLLRDVALADGDLAFGADVFFFNGIPILDVSEPLSPNPRAIIDFRTFADDEGTGIAVDSSFAYLSGESALYLGQYRALEDEGGSPPEVTLTAPADGSEAIAGDVVVVTAEASDDVGVAAVLFLVDGVIEFSDSAPPFRFNFSVPAGQPRIALGAVAIDFGENSSSASPVELVISADPLTTVVGRVIDSGGRGLEGVEVELEGLDLGTTTAADGAFLIAGVPTTSGPLQPVVTGRVEGVRIVVRPEPLAAVPGGTTDFGTIVLEETRAGPLFPRILYLTAGNTSEVATADLDADGQRDVVTVQGGSAGRIGALLSRGEGTFGRPLFSALDTGNTTSFALADFDGDDRADVYVNDVANREVVVFRGQGDGTFVRGPSLAQGNPGKLVTGDLDDDGLDDLAILNGFPEHVSIVGSQSGGTLQEEAQLTVSLATALAVADLDGDRLGDVVVGSDNDDIRVFLRNDDGTYQGGVRYNGGNVRNLAIGDLNGDGRPDVATSNARFFQFGRDVSIFLGVGDGTFEQEIRLPQLPESPGAIGIQDVGRDGMPDLVLQHREEVAYYRGLGEATFAEPQFVRFGRPGARAISFADDLTGDGVPDVLLLSAIDASRDAIWVLEGNDDPAGLPFEAGITRVSTGNPGSHVIAEDLDGDGLADIATGAFNAAVFVRSLGGGELAEPVSVPLPSAVRDIAAADIDGDGIQDLIIQALDIVTLRGTPDGLSDARQDFPTGGAGPEGLFVADIDGDGLADVVTLSNPNRFSRNLSVLLGNGEGGFSAPLLTAVADNRTMLVAISDVDLDGPPDAVVWRSGVVSVRPGNGDGTFGAAIEFTDFSLAPRAVGDLTGDGRPDLVESGFHFVDRTYGLNVFPGNGDGTFDASPIELEVASELTEIRMTDINLDGLTDLIAADGFQVSVFLATEEGELGAPALVNLRGEDLSVRDIDGDGLPDLTRVDGGDIFDLRLVFQR